MINKCAFITGASRGIGKAIAIKFAQKGYNLVINCKSSIKELQLLKEFVEHEYKIHCIASIGDVGDATYIERLFVDIKSQYGRLDVLINNAGISHIGLLQDMTLQQWDTIMQTNLTSAFLCSKFAISLMLPAHTGSIVNISSVWGSCGASCEVAYSASKGGLNTFTKALAKELAPSGIRVNAVACGTIDTDMNHFLSNEEREALVEEIPLGRMGNVIEIAESVYGIATKNSYMTGQVITLDGGWCV